MLTLSFCEEKEEDSKDEKQDASEVCRNVDRFLSINLFTWYLGWVITLCSVSKHQFPKDKH